MIAIASIIITLASLVMAVLVHNWQKKATYDAQINAINQNVADEQKKNNDALSS